MKLKLLFLAIISTITMHGSASMPEDSSAETLIQQQLAQPLMYAPWRGHYKSYSSATQDACPFCAQLAEQQDEKHLILARNKNFVVMMNLYPYCKGHLLIIPYKHTPDINHLSPDERADLMEVVNLSTEVLEKVMNPDGMNIGISKGKAAGASVTGHLHVHVVPRWYNNESFLGVLDRVRVITCDMHDLYKKLKEAFDSMTQQQTMPSPTFCQQEV